jgi:hypothetical protein
MYAFPLNLYKSWKQETTQALYAHMNNKKIKNFFKKSWKQLTPIILSHDIKNVILLFYEVTLHMTTVALMKS